MDKLCWSFFGCADKYLAAFFVATRASTRCACLAAASEIQLCTLQEEHYHIAMKIVVRKEEPVVEESVAEGGITKNRSSHQWVSYTMYCVLVAACR